MELSAGIQASLAGRYASALFDLASEAGTVTAVEGDLDRLAGPRPPALVALIDRRPALPWAVALLAFWVVSTRIGIGERLEA